MGAERCQQESILLLASVRGPRGGDGCARALRDCARPDPPGGIYGGKGGRLVVVRGSPWGPSLALCQISGSEICEKNVFCSKLLEKSICQVPVA